jgi:HSP20 family protein
MALVRWENPLRELASMEVERLNHMFSNLYGEGLSRAWMPPVDIFETAQREVVIKAELPDVKREDISVTFENNILTLRGERRFESDVPREQFQRAERFYGSFSRSFTIPATVDATQISAAYKDGVLTVRLPQREEAKPKQIAVTE